MKSEASKTRFSLVASMSIFGTIGLVRRFLPVPSGFLAMTRGLLGAVFLLLLMRLRRTSPSRNAIRANLWRLCLSGVLIGANWILLFEAYRFTTVATATLCYYMSPAFVVLASPLVFHERLTPRRLLCVAAALCGMVLVSGILGTGISHTELAGVLCALGAAALYASVVLLNKSLGSLDAYDKTTVQLAVAGGILIPYVLLTENIRQIAFTPLTVTLLLVVGIVHTGFAYALYFGSMRDLSAQTIALLSYLDPVIAVLLSALVLREPMSGLQTFGAMLILCAAAVAELPARSNS